MLNGDINFDHLGCCYPSTFEQKINDIAGEKITCMGPSAPFFSAFVTTFCIKNEKKDLFFKKVFPNLITELNSNNIFVFDQDEVTND